MTIEHFKRGPDGIDGIIKLYEIPEEFALNKDLFDAWWLPKTEIGSDGLYHIVEPARISDEAKAQRLVKEPVHNLITNAGITRYLNNNATSAQSGCQPITQILSVGNGTISGVTRTDTSVAGDGFATGARRDPTSGGSHSIVGFQLTVIVPYSTSQGNGTWTNIGWYGDGTATTTTGTGTLYTHALFPFVKGSGSAYSINYVFLMSN